MAAGASRKLSAPSSRSHTRNPKEKTSIMFLSSGLLRKVFAICCVGFLAWAYREITPPPPITCGSPDGPPITAPRIKLSDGRHLAYKEHGVPRNRASYKMVFVHCFDCCRHDIAVAATLSPNLIESLGIYIVSFDRPGYGESDPNPKQKEKSIALDIQELADQLELGSKFYVVGFSMGGQGVWSCLKYIPHRINGLSVFLTIFHGSPTGGTLKSFFPALSYTAYEPSLLNPQDIEVMAKYLSAREKYQDQVNQQGDFESLHRDLIVGFGKWEFDPMDLENPFPNNEGSVHLWQGDEDGLVPVTLQRYIAQKLPWIHYHQLPGAGHMFPYVDAMGEKIVKALLHT
nr:Abhydrolase_6 domain-containing protein [Ipomoea batatas]